MALKIVLFITLIMMLVWTGLVTRTIMLLVMTVLGRAMSVFVMCPPPVWIAQVYAGYDAAMDYVGYRDNDSIANHE